MRRVTLAALVCLAGCGGGDKLATTPSAPPSRLQITSPDFPRGGAIPTRFSCDGAKARPALRFAGVPDDAAELALIVVDPNAGGFVHWTVYSLQPGTREIGATGLPAGAREGENSQGKTGWTPPCPPSGTHRYEFHLYWLKRKSGLSAGAGPGKVADAVRNAAGGGATLVGHYTRR